MKQITFTHSEIEQLAKAGGAAPSGGNAQPWKLTVDSNILLIGLHKERSTSFLDVMHYASFFAIGCFMENLLIQAQSLGLVLSVSYLPFNNYPNPFIKLTLINKTKPKRNDLQKSLFVRHTNRNLHEGPLIEKEYIEKILNPLKNQKKIKIYIHNSMETKQKIATTLGIADAIRMTNQDLFQQMMKEFRWTQKETITSCDGLDIKTLELPANFEKLFRLSNTYPRLAQLIPKSAFSKLAHPLILGSSHVGCLTIKSLSARHVVEAGKMFERIWLLATQNGIALQPWSVLPFLIIRNNYYKGKGFSTAEQKEIKLAEKELRMVFAIPQKEFPLFIFRLSRAKPPSAVSLRVPWQSYTFFAPQNTL